MNDRFLEIFESSDEAIFECCMLNWKTSIFGGSEDSFKSEDNILIDF